MGSPIEELFHSLLASTDERDPIPVEVLPHARLDVDRANRKGVPEVVLAQGKAPQDVIDIARAFVDRTGRAIISRVGADLLSSLRATFSTCHVETCSQGRTVVVKRPGYATPRTGGRVGLVTAGTADIPTAEEAMVVAREMGCDVFPVFDVGVAGLHRLFRPLHALQQVDVDVIVVAAGMDGALPSVVAGLVDVPVIGLPTSAGYGLGGQGVGALMAMLQTCSPGLVVVNVDNGVGAGATAGLIANRAARARGGQQTERRERGAPRRATASS